MSGFLFQYNYNINYIKFYLIITYLKNIFFVSFCHIQF